VFERLSLVRERRERERERQRERVRGGDIEIGRILEKFNLLAYDSFFRRD
jgi:hypothetical protein